jgi:hypothetical protein
MAHTRWFRAFGLAAFTLMVSLSLAAHASPAKNKDKDKQPAEAVTLNPGDPAPLIQDKLLSQIRLTKATADHTDIITAGDVVVLQQDGLMMSSSACSYAYSNSYSGGVLTSNMKNRAKDTAKSVAKAAIFGKLGLGGSSVTDAAANVCATRKFVAGEKFWVTGIVAQKDGILVRTSSDPYNDIRYYGELLFTFVNGVVPPVDDFVKSFSEVITVQSEEGQSGQGDQPASEAAQEPAPDTMSDIAPPPPPPPTIEAGQTKDQVTAAFGQPLRVAKFGVKEIYFYKDMKVTFTSGKVSKIE